MADFKKTKVFKLLKPLELQLDKFNEQLLAFCFQPVRRVETYRFGWVPPLDGLDSLFYCSGEAIYLKLRSDSKVLPAKAINKALADDVARLEKKENRKVGRKERLTIKDEIVAGMTLDALVVSSDVGVCIDVARGYIYVNTGSNPDADRVLDTLRFTLGSLPVVPLNTEHTPSVVMRSWLNPNGMPQGVSVGRQVKVYSGLEETVSATFNDVDLTVDDSNHLDDFGHVESMDLAVRYREDDGRLSGVLNDGEYKFRLTEGLTVTGLKYDFDCPEAYEDDADQYRLLFDTGLFVYLQTIRQLVDFIHAQMGKPEDHKAFPVALSGLEGDQDEAVLVKIAECLSGQNQDENEYIGDEVVSDG
ncbi:recombination-associated protein RdgC [Oceanospirillum sp. HFRX-1_2]